MRLLLSNHHLVSPINQGKVVELYEVILKEALVSNEDIIQACALSLSAFELSGMLPSASDLIDAGFTPDTKTVSESEIEYHIDTLSKSAHFKKLKKDVMSLSSINDISEYRETLNSLQSGTISTEDLVDSAVALEDMHSEEILNKVEYSGEGAMTGISDLDNILYSIPLGVMACMFAGRSMGKSTFVDNFVYLNTVQKDYNGLYFSLEIPRDTIYLRLLSRHSYHMNPSKAIPFAKIRRGFLDDSDKGILIEVEKDLKKNQKGRLRILDMSSGIDFNPLEFGGFLESIYKKDPFNLVTFDYIQLVKFSTFKGISEYDLQNKLVAILRQKTVSIGGGNTLITLILSQANQDGIERAIKRKGKFDLRAVAEANEINKSCPIVMSLYLDDVLRSSSEIKFQLLKNREGELIEEPGVSFFDPAHIMMGESSAYNKAFDPQHLEGNIDFDLGDDLDIF